jgi:LmbE family N-acetylglucosaminyl deacetylase
MKKTLLFLLLIICFLPVFAENPDDKPKALIISAHPDDWEGNIGGTVLLLKDQYKFHVLIATKGERGIKGKTHNEAAAIREVEAQKACDVVGADLHFMGQIDQDVYASKEAVANTVKLLEELDPELIFTMWPVDVADHAGAGTIGRLALYRTGMIYDREVYFFETKRGGQTNQFIPDFYVNVSEVIEERNELLRHHVCQNTDDRLVQSHYKQSAFHGEVARCKYAEAIKTFLPITNWRWDKDYKYSLLEIENENTKHLYDDNKEVLIICTHPDDWEIAMGGTALKMKDKYNMHVLVLTRGEMALGKDKKEETISLRKEQEEKTAAMINADLNILPFPDAGLTADKHMVDSVIKILEGIDPGIVFCHWGMDKADHAAANSICTKALATTGMIHDRQIYYFGVGTTSLCHFEPEFFINIDNEWEEKVEMLKIHHLPNHGEYDLINMAKMPNAFFGQVNRCKYAEGFRTHYPMVNHRWDKKALHWLLELE